MKIVIVLNCILLFLVGLVLFEVSTQVRDTRGAARRLESTLASRTRWSDQPPRSTGNQAVEHPASTPSPEDEVESWPEATKSEADLRAARSALGQAPQPDRLAALLEDCNDWHPVQGEEAAFESIRGSWIGELRELVVARVRQLQGDALRAPSGSEALRLHAQAARVLALFPVSEDEAVINQAQSLAAGQSSLLLRIEVIRRQRYNRWAVDRVDAAIRAYRAANISVEVPGRTDGPQILAAAVANLGGIEPAILDVAVLSLYQYAVETINQDLDDAERVRLARSLEEVAGERKTLENF